MYLFMYYIREPLADFPTNETCPRLRIEEHLLGELATLPCVVAMLQGEFGANIWKVLVGANTRNMFT